MGRRKGHIDNPTPLYETWNSINSISMWLPLVRLVLWRRNLGPRNPVPKMAQDSRVSLDEQQRVQSLWM